jgi:uncharacterized protein
MSSVAGFASLEKAKYLNLETFRKNGQGVRTPIWFAADPERPLSSSAARLYMYTVADVGKVKRIRNNGHVRVAPCNARGNVLGDWMDARAEIVTGVEAARGMELLNKKYRPLKQILGFFAMFSRRGRVVLTIKPA